MLYVLEIDEFAIKVESLKLRLNKKKQKKTPSKDSRSKIRRLIFQRKKERERGSNKGNQVSAMISNGK